jgi:acyl-coenzyme A thioesterase PaaI-like protein
VDTGGRAVTDGAPVADDPFVVYSHIGTSARPLTQDTAEGTLQLRDDLRLPYALLAGPLAVLVLDCASANTRALAASAPTRIDVDLWDPATDVRELRIRGRVVRHARSQIFTEARIEDAADADRVLGYAMTSFSVTGPPPASVQYGHAGVPVGGGARLTEVFGGRPRGDGGFDIPALTPALGHGRLHSGVMQVLAEAAAIEVVRRRTGRQTVWVHHLGTTVATSGRVGPFSVIPTLLGVAGGCAGCTVDVVDEGADGRRVAVVSVGLRVGE